MRLSSTAPLPVTVSVAACDASPRPCEVKVILSEVPISVLGGMKAVTTAVVVWPAVSQALEWDQVDSIVIYTNHSNRQKNLRQRTQRLQVSFLVGHLEIVKRRLFAQIGHLKVQLHRAARIGQQLRLNAHLNARHRLQCVAAQNLNDVGYYRIRTIRKSIVKRA